MTIVHHTHPQGSQAWLDARRGCITGSNFRIACEKLRTGQPSKAALDYARDLARERLGGRAPARFQNAAMRTGTEQEPLARRAYELRTGLLVDEVGFFATEDGAFGCSPDGLVHTDGVLEIKTMVSSDTLFTALAEGDLSAYRAQCLGYLWLLGRKWVDLVLWVPDLQHLAIHRIERDEEAIEDLEADLLAFLALTRTYEQQLRAALAPQGATA
ncbi:YqaJ viral recombinase family protein [Pulveribacter sp.]|uniref:lambda exonuclease family protein n=1 Tax=Pulveribacter sp. TaxID=2678893 RepID=UPI0028AC81AA|nr:YqaJ viral recombinase family protein [Pulveribacter sp.]